MKKNGQVSYLLEDFEGPLDFLLHLVRKSEVDVYGISIKQITDQFLDCFTGFDDQSLDDGAEFISDAAVLMWLKSKMLLPKHDQPASEEDGEQDPKFEIIHQLYDYCLFRDAGKTLSSIEQEQSGHFFRGADNLEVGKPLGIEHLSLDDFASMFKDALNKAKDIKGKIHEEDWKVSDKIKWITKEIQSQGSVYFMSLFSPKKSRAELIVTFLAVLELMKLGTARIVKETSTGKVMVIQGEQ